MPPEVAHYIVQYGYLSVFILIFLQETGMPNPVPNELVLLFSGYLVYSGVFSFYQVLATALLADFTGTNILYFVFRNFGQRILKNKPRWIPLSQQKIDSLTRGLSRGGLLNIFVCRLSPFIRGYTSVIAVLMQVRKLQFLAIAFLSATLWAGAYLTAGWLLGPWWKQMEQHSHLFRNIMLSLLALTVLFLALRAIYRKQGIRIRGSSRI